MFYFPISHQDIAEQIASLLNTHNELAMRRRSHDIMHGKTNYVVETHGQYVIGVAGIQRISYQLSEFKHMVVHPDWRRKGVGKFVARRALQICETPSIYATVRTTNVASVRTLEKLGFSQAHETPASGHQVALLVRVAPKCLQSTAAPKSRSWLEANLDSLTLDSQG